MLDPEGESEWTLDTLTAAVQQRGIQVARSQVRRIFVQEGVRWRRTRLGASSKDPDFIPKGPGSSCSTPSHLKGQRMSSRFGNALHRSYAESKELVAA